MKLQGAAACSSWGTSDWIDAFEEVFTLCLDESARTAFIDNLIRAAAVAGGQTVVVLTMRADFLGKCATHPALAAALSDHQALVGPMTEDELRRSIERPARRVGCEVDAGLVDVLIQDVQGQSGALPLMQYALLELWQRRDGRRLKLESYRAIGGLRGALERRANEVLGQLSEGERELCRRIFLRLTQPGEGTEDTKRRASYQELAAVGAEAESVQAVLRRLADARLITTEGDERRPGEGTVDVAHEALIRGWPELRKWIDADRAGLRTQRRLTEAAREWESNGRDASFLYGGARLAVANEWAESRRAELNVLETGFLSASVEAEGRRQADEVAKARALVALERGRLRLTLALAATLLLAVVGAAAGALWYQYDQSTRATEAAHLATEKAANDARQAAEHARKAANTERAVTAALEEAMAFAKQATELHDDPAKWEAALEEERSAVERAEGVLNGGEGGADLRARVGALRSELEAAKRDQRMIAGLEAARFQGAAAGHEGGWDKAGAVALYRAAFQRDDQGWDSLAQDEAATRVNQRVIREDLLAALDEWAFITPNQDEAKRLHGIVKAADPNPGSFRNRCHALLQDVGPEVPGGPDPHGFDSLRRLAFGPEAQDVPTARLVNVGRELSYVGAASEAVEFFKEANEVHPGDFWIAFELARAYQTVKPPATDELIRYFTAAVMLRPKSVAAHYHLGFALKDKGHLGEAIAEFRKCLQIQPDNAKVHYVLGFALKDKGDLGEANALFRKAIQIQSDNAEAHYNLAIDLQNWGRLDEAIEEFRKCLQIQPDDVSHFAGAAAFAALFGCAQGEYTAKADDKLRSDHGYEEPPPLVIPGDNAAKADDQRRRESRPELEATFSDYDDKQRRAKDDLENPPIFGPPTFGGYYAAKADDKQRGRWRQQALDWFRAALSLWTKKIDDAKPENRPLAAYELQYWQVDSRLAGVRDQDALAKLPADEQDAWRKLWADVDALLKKAQEK